MLGWLRNRKSYAPDTSQGVPTVKFDPKRVSSAVEDDLYQSLSELNTLPQGSHKAIFEAALASFKAGRDLKSLTDVLTQVGVERGDAADIAMQLNNRATSIMRIERELKLGINEGIWLYSGMRCFEHYPPTPEDELRDGQHKAANGASFPLADGLMIAERRVYPGRERGCKCTFKSVMPFAL